MCQARRVIFPVLLPELVVRLEIFRSGKYAAASYRELIAYIVVSNLIRIASERTNRQLIPHMAEVVAVI